MTIEPTIDIVPGDRIRHMGGGLGTVLTVIEPGKFTYKMDYHSDAAIAARTFPLEAYGYKRNAQGQIVLTHWRH